MLSALLLALAPTTSTIVQIDQRTLRVEVKGEEVRVFNKAFLTKPSPQLKAQMKRAVVQVTGCDITEEYWRDARLEGVLSCPKR